MDSPPILLDVRGALGERYLQAMELAGEYAYAVCDRVLEILGAESVDEIHNHHNFAWREEVDGTDAWVVRKGCTPAFAGQRGFVGATMGEDSVILEGTEAAASAGLLSSTVHGAGRVMSRTKAAGKFRRPWACTRPDCDWIQERGTPKPQDGRCPVCGHDPIVRRPVQAVAGLIDWDAARADLKASNVELRGAGPDEAPGAYKRLDQVLEHHADTVRVLHRLQPIGVAMAGTDVHDPWKD